MTLHLLTYNIQGPSMRNKRVSIRTFLERFRPKIDVLCVQEHHLRAGEVKALKREMCRDAVCAPAFDGARALRNPTVMTGKGGIFMAINSKWSSYIQDQGVLGRKLGVWCIFGHPHLGRFGIIGVYAPTVPKDRTILWNELFGFLDNNIPWLFLGHLNMVESATDQYGGNPRELAVRELREFSHLKRRMKWEDTFERIPGGIAYTWDNKRTFAIPTAVTTQGDRIEEDRQGLCPTPSCPSALIIFLVAAFSY